MMAASFLVGDMAKNAADCANTSARSALLNPVAETGVHETEI